MESTTPDTAAYLFLGLGVILTLMIGYVGNLWLRYHNLTKDIQTIETLNEPS